MVNPISFPAPQAWSGGADFTPLANLGNVYQKAQADALKQSTLAQLGSDPNANANLLVSSGHPELATLGIDLQNKLQAQAEQKREFEARQALAVSADKRAAAAEGRAARKDEEDSYEGRAAKLVAAGLDIKDPAYAAHLATGAPLPSVIQQHVDQRAADEEARAKIKFEQEQKVATPEGRRKIAVENELDLKDPGIRNWIIAGGDLAKARTSLGQPIWTKDAAGRLTPYQQSTSGDPVPMRFPEGQVPLGPGEVASQKQEAVSLAKSKAAAAAALPKLADQVATNTKSLDELSTHKGRDNATGKWRGQLPDESTLLSQEGIDFRSRFKHVKSQAFLSAFDTLRGAGAISNSEGDAAKAAINRLSTVTSKDEFDTALQEAKDYYQLGLNRARRAAKGDFSEHPAELRPGDYATGGNREPLTDIFNK